MQEKLSPTAIRLLGPRFLLVLAVGWTGSSCAEVVPEPEPALRSLSDRTVVPRTAPDRKSPSEDVAKTKAAISPDAAKPAASASSDKKRTARFKVPEHVGTSPRPAKQPEKIRLD